MLLQNNREERIYMSKEELYLHTFTYAQLRESVEDCINTVRSEISSNPAWAPSYEEALMFYEDLICHMYQEESICIEKEELYKRTYTYAQLRGFAEHILNIIRSEISANPVCSSFYKDDLKFHEDLICHMDQFEAENLE